MWHKQEHPKQEFGFHGHYKTSAEPTYSAARCDILHENPRSPLDESRRNSLPNTCCIKTYTQHCNALLPKEVHPRAVFLSSPEKVNNVWFWIQQRSADLPQLQQVFGRFVRMGYMHASLPRSVSDCIRTSGARTR